jgi:hemolysin activation/secretion protein
VSVDNAVLLNLEIETPHMSPSKCVGKTKKIEDDLYFIAFFDCGFGVNHIHNLGESRTKTLASIGPGIRYQYSRFVTGRLDYGYQLWHSGFENPSRSRYNFGLIISY